MHDWMSADPAENDGTAARQGEALVELDALEVRCFDRSHGFLLAMCDPAVRMRLPNRWRTYTRSADVVANPPAGPTRARACTRLARALPVVTSFNFSRGATMPFGHDFAARATVIRYGRSVLGCPRALLRASAGGSGGRWRWWRG